MHALNKTNAILIGLIFLVLVLMMGSIFIDSNTRYNKLKAENDAREHATSAAVVEPEFDINAECPTYQADNSAGKYENIPGACFDYFHISDAALESRLRSLTPYENPCYDRN